MRKEPDATAESARDSLLAYVVTRDFLPELLILLARMSKMCWR